MDGDDGDIVMVEWVGFDHGDNSVAVFFMLVIYYL